MTFSEEIVLLVKIIADFMRFILIFCAYLPDNAYFLGVLTDLLLELKLIKVKKS